MATPLFFRVIQMIDENKEQLRNLFRKYNVVDVQPAVTDKLPDDITTLQVQETRQLTAAKMRIVWMYLLFQHLNIVCTCILLAGNHHPCCAAVLGWNLFCHNELALPQSVRTSCVTRETFSVSVRCVAGAGSITTMLTSW